MKEVNIGEVSSDVTVESATRGIEIPSADAMEALEHAEALRARALRIADRTRADGFED